MKCCQSDKKSTAEALKFKITQISHIFVERLIIDYARQIMKFSFPLFSAANRLLQGHQNSMIFNRNFRIFFFEFNRFGFFELLTFWQKSFKWSIVKKRLLCSIIFSTSFGWTFNGNKLSVWTKKWNQIIKKLFLNFKTTAHVNISDL